MHPPGRPARGRGGQRTAPAAGGFPALDLGDGPDGASGPFMDTAHHEDLDPVVTVNSSPAHPAGALGVPTWVLLSSPPPTGDGSGTARTRPGVRTPGSSCNRRSAIESGLRAGGRRPASPRAGCVDRAPRRQGRPAARPARCRTSRCFVSGRTARPRCGGRRLRPAVAHPARRVGTSTSRDASE